MYVQVILHHPAAAKVTASIEDPAKKKGDDDDMQAAEDALLFVLPAVPGTYMSPPLSALYASTTEHLAESAHLVASARHMADWSATVPSVHPATSHPVASAILPTSAHLTPMALRAVASRALMTFA